MFKHLCSPFKPPLCLWYTVASHHFVISRFFIYSPEKLENDYYFLTEKSCKRDQKSRELFKMDSFGSSLIFCLGSRVMRSIDSGVPATHYFLVFFTVVFLIHHGDECLLEFVYRKPTSIHSFQPHAAYFYAYRVLS